MFRWSSRSKRIVPPVEKVTSPTCSEGGRREERKGVRGRRWKDGENGRGERKRVERRDYSAHAIYGIKAM